jgi:hypothetical protein
MPNAIKYNVSAETLALKKGNFWIGTGDVGKGPTSSTGYYNGITSPSGGYTIYLNKETGGPSIYVASNDSQLISLTNTIANQSYTTVAECFNYFRDQSDKLVVNSDYGNVITDGLVLNMDAGFRASYTTSGNTWYDISLNSNTTTLTNGSAYNSNDSGSISFDGVDDYVGGSFSLPLASTSFTCEAWIKPSIYSGERCIFGKGPFSTRTGIHWRFIGNGSNACLIRWGFYSSDIDTTTYCVPFNTWSQVVFSYFYDGVNNLGKIYVNGVEQNTVLAFGNPLGPYLGSDSATNYFGTWTLGTQQFLGLISIFRIYNRTLSTSEILQNYNAQKERFGL